MITDTSEARNKAQLKRTIWIAALAGTALFALLAAVLAINGKQSAIASPLFDVYKTFAVVVLSMLGGVRWGVLLVSTEYANPGRSAVLAALAPMFGWVALFLTEPMSFALLAVCFAGQGAFDNFSAHNGHLPGWYSTIRLVMTIIMVASLALVMFITR